MNENAKGTAVNESHMGIADGIATPIMSFRDCVSATTAKVIPIDGPNKGEPEYRTVFLDGRLHQLTEQLNRAHAVIARLQAELDRYAASGKVLNTAYDITCNKNYAAGVNEYRIRLNDEFKNICDGISYLEGLGRILLTKRIGKGFLNDMTAYLAQVCFAVSREEVVAKIDRSGDATDSVTAGIRTIRELIGAFECAVSAVSPQYPQPNWYAAKMKQLGSSMNLKEFEMFLVCFTGEIITDSRVYRDLTANPNFTGRLSRFQLDLQFAAELVCDYPLLLTKPATHLIGFMASVNAGDDIARAVRAFRSGIPVCGMTNAVSKTETPLDDRACDVLEFCIANGATGVSAKAMMEHIHESSKSHFQKTTLQALRERGYLAFTCDDAHSSHQRYRITQDGATALQQARPGRTYSVPSHTDPDAVPTDSEIKRSEPHFTGTADPTPRNSQI